MGLERLANAFLEAHVNASEIVMDEVSGFPVKAIYRGADVTGNIRKEPAVFYFNPYVEKE